MMWLWLIIASGLVYADPVDEGLLTTAKATGAKVYFACIVTPPVNTAKKAICRGLYNSYMAALTAVNAPLPLVVSVDPDPYAWSPYDICRYETGHVVFGEQLSVPYCPTL